MKIAMILMSGIVTYLLVLGLRVLARNGVRTSSTFTIGIAQNVSSLKEVVREKGKSMSHPRCR